MPATTPRTQNGDSFSPSISADGRYIVFSSSVDDLIPDDTNGKPDVFVYDRITKAVERVSVSSNGEQSNGASWSGSFSISADGRWITYSSEATNLAPDDANKWNLDVFVHDRLTRETKRVSISSDGMQGNNGSGEPAISSDGRYVVFTSLASNLVPGDARDTWDIFVHDRLTGTTELVSTTLDGRAAGASDAPVISADGRYIAFWSFAMGLVADDTKRGDVFIYDRRGGTMTRIVANEPSGVGRCGYGLGISADGRYVGFYSLIYDWQAAQTEPGGLTPRFSADGHFVVYIEEGIVLRDRQTGESKRISVAGDGTPSNGLDGYIPHHEGCTSGHLSISADGQWIAFASSASNLTPDSAEVCYDYFRPEPRNCYNIFLYDRTTGTLERISAPADQQ